MSKFRTWGLSVVTMVSVATAVLLVTGWGSALGGTITSVLVTNTASRPVPVTPIGTAKVTVQNVDATGNIKVHEQGTANVKVSNFPATQGVSGTVNVGNLPSTQAVSGSVSVSNLPAAAATAQISEGSTSFPAGTGHDFIVENVAAYRAVTLYFNQLDTVTFGAPSSPGLRCDASTSSTGSSNFQFEEFNSGTAFSQMHTYDPAPPRIRIGCMNLTSDPVTIVWMFAGRTG
jgi:hypothetical protein